MNTPSIVKYAFANAVLTAFYVVLVALFMSSTKALFGNNENALIPMAMLLLLIFSATLCGSLVFGRPVMWYLDGKKGEALKLLGWTALFLFIMMVAIFVVLYFVNN
jgi:hypothetical protein